MDDIVKLVIDEFKKQPDDSWVCVKNSDITTKAGRVIRITPGTVFKKGSKPWGLDIAQALEELSVNQK